MTRIHHHILLLTAMLLGFAANAAAQSNAEISRTLNLAVIEIKKKLPEDLGDGISWFDIDFNPYGAGTNSNPQVVFTYKFGNFTDSSLSSADLAQLRSALTGMLQDTLKDGFGNISGATLRRYKLGLKVSILNKYNRSIGIITYSASELFPSAYTPTRRSDATIAVADSVF